MNLLNDSGGFAYLLCTVFFPAVLAGLNVLRFLRAARRRPGLLVLLVALLAGAVGAADDKLPPVPDSATWYRDLMQRTRTNSTQLIEEAEARLASARAAHDAVGEAYALSALAHGQARLNDLPPALENSAAALLLAGQLGLPELLPVAQSARVRALNDVSDFDDALDLGLKMLRAAESGSDHEYLMFVYEMLSISHRGLREADLALDYAARALAEAELTGVRGQIAARATWMGRLYRERGNFVEARRSLDRAYAIRLKVPHRAAMADIEDEIAALDFAEGHWEQALATLNRVEVQRRSLRGKLSLTTLLIRKAEILTKLSRLDEARTAVDEAVGYANTINKPALSAAVYGRLSSVLAACGEYQAALEAIRTAYLAERENTNEVSRRHSVELQARYEVAKKDDELARLARVNEARAATARIREAELARSQAELEATEVRSYYQRLALIAGLVATGAVLGTMVVASRTRLRASRRILEETRAARDAAEEADALKSRFLGFASHDLKSPIASFTVAVHLLEQRAEQPQQVRALAGALRAEAARMTHLVHDFLDRAALDAGRLELRLSPLDLAVVVEAVVADLLPVAERKSQTLTLERPAHPLPAIEGEAARLAQVFANLVDNAIKYTPTGGDIRVVLGSDSASVWCEVSDTGPGLKPQELARLFQPFARLSAQPTGGESSTGLGLHLARELISLHGGALSVDSLPGRGATFRVTLPAKVS